MAQGESLSGKVKTRKSILAMVLLMKSHLTSITSAPLILPPVGFNSYGRRKKLGVVSNCVTFIAVLPFNLTLYLP